MVHHEFWPTSLLHLPLYFYYLGQSIRFGSLNYFAWANPQIPTGGLVGYSKYEILKHLPADHIPRTLAVNPTQDFEEVEKDRQGKRIDFPLIAKPDLGGGEGFKVKFIQDVEQLRKYHKNSKQTYLIQEYVDEPEEFGVVFFRTGDHFQLTSVVQKDFLILYGDGRSDIKTLHRKNQRAKKFFSEHQLPHYSERVLEVGEKILLQPIASRAYGTRFINANSIIDEQMTDCFNKLSKNVPQFYCGRIEVRAESVSDLLEGRFKVVDIAGVGGSPAHIYDPNYKTSQAIKDLLQHWRQISRLVKVNRSKFKKESAFTTLKTIFKYYFNRGSL